MSESTRNRIILTAIFVLPFAFFLSLMVFDNHPAPLKNPTLPNHPAPPTDAPMPNPNGYDKLVEAAARLQGDARHYDTMSQAQLSSLVASNSVALALAHSALTNEYYVPVQNTRAAVNSHMKEGIPFTSLAQTIAAEGRLAELENRTNEAVKCYLDDIHFGIEAGRGGNFIDVMLGNFIEILGRTGLEMISGQLDAKTCREAALAMESFEANRPLWTNVMQQESLWSGAFDSGLQAYATNTLVYKQHMTMTREAEKGVEKVEAVTRRLMIQLAARAFELEKGHPPANISDLVPDYLKTVPQDPATGKNMVLPP